MNRIYQVSDLAKKKRTEMIAAAQAGPVHIRARDGTALVLVRQNLFDHYSALSHQLRCLVMLGAALERPAPQRRVTDFGDMAWVAKLDDEDRRIFMHELLEALTLSLSEESTEPVKECLRDWRTTALALSDPKVRAALTATGAELTEFDEVSRPG